MLDFLKNLLGSGNETQLKKLNKPVEAVMALEEAYRGLTDEQLVAIFQYTQLGAKALDRFRQLPADTDGDIHGAEVSE